MVFVLSIIFPNNLNFNVGNSENNSEFRIEIGMDKN